MISKEINGEFVNLRPLQISDAEQTFIWRSALRARNLNESAASVQLQAQWIASRPSEEYNFIIELKSGHSVGMLSLVNIDMINLHGEPGRFLIGDDAAVKGVPVAVEAMKLLYKLAFDQLGLVRVSGIVAESNPLMTKWHKYMGMKEEGRLRNYIYQNGEFLDGILLSLLIDEYRKITLPRMNGLIDMARKSKSN